MVKQIKPEIYARLPKAKPEVKARGRIRLPNWFFVVVPVVIVVASVIAGR